LGGTSKSGVDCSALVRALYQDVYGVGLPRTAEEQERLGTKIDRKNLVVGDLVFFRTQGMGPFFKSRHVGIYVGNGEFAQASGRLGVNIARLDNYYWNKKYVGARRLPKS
jgi:lipoprotein Spr